MISATEKIICAVEESCIASPLTRQRMRERLRVGDLVARDEPRPDGANVSGDLPRVHCPSANCRSRALTSLTQM